MATFPLSLLVVSEDPDHREQLYRCLRGLGHPIVTAGDFREARALLDGLLARHPLLARDPKFARGLLLRAVLYNEANEFDNAIPLLRQVVAVDRDNRKEALYQLGRKAEGVDANPLAVRLSELKACGRSPDHLEALGREARRAASRSNFQGGWVLWLISAIRLRRGMRSSHSLSSSTTIASAFCSSVMRSRVISPRIRTARPGPGNG